MLQNTINGILGLAVIVIAFLGLTAATLTWTLVVVGVAVALVSLWGLVGDTNEVVRHA